MRQAERLLRAVADALAAAGAAALAGIFALVFAAVVMRYAWGRPLAATEELSGLLMTAAVFALLPLTVLDDVHIRVTLLAEKLGRVGAVAAYVAGQTILVAFVAIFVRDAWAISEFTQRLGLMSEHSRLPLAPFLIFATGAAAYAGLCGLWRIVRKPDAPSGGSGVH